MVVHSQSDVIGFFLHTLSFVVSPSLLEAAATHGIKESGIKNVEDILSAVIRKSKGQNDDGVASGAAEDRTDDKKRKARDADGDEDESKSKKKARAEPTQAALALVEPPRKSELNFKQVCSRIMNSQVLSELMRHVRENRQGFNYICASAAVSKAAKMMNKRSQSDVNDFMELVEIARGYLPEMEARNLSNLIYSLAKAGQSNKDLIREILSHAGHSIDDFDPQNLANTIWALATLNYPDAAAFVKQLLKKAEAKLRDFSPQALSNTVWALATLNYSDGSNTFIKQLLKDAGEKLSGFKPQELANTIWSLATLNYKDGSSFVEKLLKEAETKLKDFDPQNLSNTLWALASLKVSNGSSFIKRLLKESEPKLCGFKPQEFANTIWALATLNYFDGSAFIELLLREAESKLSDFKPQNLANTAWALAVLDHSNAPLFLKCFLPFAYKMADRMANENRRQSLQYLLLMEDGGHVTAEIKSNPQYVKFRRMCQEVEADERTSRTQLEIFEAIRRLPGCSDAVSEYLTDDGFFRIDIALQLNGGQKLAIEVDGPTHFLSDGKTLNGSTGLRNRLLEKRGWKVISIPVTEWRTFQSQDDKEAYLLSYIGPHILEKKKRKRERVVISNENDTSEPTSPRTKKKKRLQALEETELAEEPVLEIKLRKKKKGKKVQRK